mmetsp:Transcript_21112/g.58742  ORF Transcript_21112/g.58742 Transcript_21112/m.58742 type:complete len:450 (+) Transcript_21112:2-1351(+)
MHHASPPIWSQSSSIWSAVRVHSAAGDILQHHRRTMNGLLQFGLLFVSFFLQPTSFGTAFTLSPPRGLPYETIADLARKRYSNNRDGGEEPPMKGRVAVITGAAGGIGGELSRAVFRLGGTVIALDRNTAGLEALQRNLVDADNDNVNDGDNDNDNDARDRIVLLQTNHEDLSSVASAAESILSRFDRIDLLINNAGIAYGTDQAKKPAMVSAHGKDLAFTVNYLSHFLLTEKLMPSLSSEGRVVHITSTFHWKVDGNDLVPSGEEGVPPAYQSDPSKQGPNHADRSYANTKLAQLWHSRSIGKLLPTGCSSVCACPLWAATGIGGESARDLLGSYAFAVSDCGPGVTSALNAVLRSDDELGDARNDGRSFVANANVVDYDSLRAVLAVITPLGWRDTFMNLTSVYLLFSQRYFHEDFLIQKTSPESFEDEEKRDRFYQWSKDEVNEWL